MLSLSVLLFGVLLGICVVRSEPSLSFRLKSMLKPAVPLIPPLLLLTLSTSKVDNSPLNQKRIEIAGPFFQGWLVRIVDHEQSLSVITIVGSFSERKLSKYSEHYVFCAIDSPSIKDHAEMFISTNDVRVSKVGGSHSVLDITWDAAEKGHFVFNDTNCSGKFIFPDKFSIAFDSAKHIMWTPANKKFSFGGPEGWLGMASSLMPCHYLVHSVGSECTYHLQILPASAKPVNPNAGLLSRFWGTSRVTRELSGKGFAHIEGNHGTAFPEGWIWSQGIAVNNTASYSLALGKFSIAGLTPTNCILYLRRTNGETVVVRTTDFDQANCTTNSTDGTVTLTARSILKQYRIDMVIHSPNRVASAFNVTVHVPTVNGFSNSPGCKETYTALTHIKFTDLSQRDHTSEEYAFPLSALEYGGSFLSKLDKQ